MHYLEVQLHCPKCELMMIGSQSSRAQITYIRLTGYDLCHLSSRPMYGLGLHHGPNRPNTAHHLRSALRVIFLSRNGWFLCSYRPRCRSTTGSATNQMITKPEDFGMAEEWVKCVPLEEAQFKIASFLSNKWNCF